MSETKQEVSHFEFIVAFLCISRHFHRWYFNELLLVGLSDSAQIRSVYTKHIDDEKLSKAWVFVKRRDRGEASNFNAKQEVKIADLQFLLAGL